MGKLGWNSGYIGSDQRDTAVGAVGYGKYYLERLDGRFTPFLSLSPLNFDNIYAWWEANTLVTTVGSLVTSWTDSIRGFVLNGANQPQYTTAIGLKPTITFDGTDDYMQTNTGNFTLDLNYTYFFVWTSRDTTNKVSLSFQSANNIIYSYNGTSFQNYKGNGSVSHNYTPNTPGLLITTNNSTTFTSKYNGSLTTSTAGTPITNNNVIIANYSLGGGGYPSNMDVAEFVVYNRVLNNNEISLLEIYFKNKYSLIY